MQIFPLCDIDMGILAQSGSAFSFLDRTNPFVGDILAL